MKRIFKVNLLFLFILVIQFFIAPFFSTFVLPFVELSLTTYQLLGTLIFLYLPVAIFVIINTKSFNCPIKEVLKFKKLNLSSIGYCILMYFCLLPITAFCNLLTMSLVPNNVVDFMNSLSSSGSNLLLFSLIAIMPAIGEELIMRGVILDGYKKVSIHVAAFMNGLLFGILHMNPSQFLYAFVLGLVLSYVVTYTGSIFSSMLIHFLFNGVSTLSFIALPYLEKLAGNEASMQATENLVADFSIIPLISTGIFAVLGGYLIFIILRKLKNCNEYDEKLKFQSHTINVGIDGSIDEFNATSPKKSFLIAYSPILVASIIFIVYMILFILSVR